MTQEKKKTGGEEEEEFLLVFLVIYSTAELRWKSIYFLSQGIHHLSLFKSAEIEMLIYLLDMIEIPSVCLSLFE